VCTIGPASRDPDTLRRLIQAGMDVARLNFSHGDQTVHGENMARIRAAAEELGRPVGILCDLQGPKLRVGTIQKGGVQLTEGQQVTLTTRAIVGHEGEIPVQYGDLPQGVEPTDHILLDDGLLELEVLHAEGTEITCRVIVGGRLESNKGMNLPRTPAGMPSMTERDVDNLRFALAHDADWIALSFVRRGEDMEALRDLVERYDRQPVRAGIMAKIEKPEGVANIEAIIAASDGIMVARGDLALETSPEEVPMLQKAVIARCNALGKPVITATQMLDSMIRNPRPTRAEASDVANAILDGTDATMLSGETAVGDYPVASVSTMARIAERVEQAPSLYFHATCPADPRSSEASGECPPQTQQAIANAVSRAACQAARELGAAAIITPTSSGYTARMVAANRPAMPVIATPHNPRVQRQLTLQWGVHPLLARRAEDTDQTIAEAIQTARHAGLVDVDDLVVLTAGSVESGPGTTNILKVQRVGRP
jgi:pyruvate kinase